MLISLISNESILDLDEKQELEQQVMTMAQKDIHLISQMDLAANVATTAPVGAEMNVLQLTEPGHLEPSTRSIPQPEGDEVLLRTRAVSICSTDVSYYHGHLRPDAYPVILGHEYVGEIVAVGPDRDGSQLIGKRLAYFGQTDFGGFADYRLLRPIFPGESKSAPFETNRNFSDDGYAAAVIVPGGVSDEVAPLLEPITAVLRAILRHPPRVGDRALVLGGGPCGAIAGAILRQLYATEVVALLECNPDRAAVAAENYAHRVYASSAELADAERNGELYDYVFDALPPIVGEHEEDDPRRAALKAIRPEGDYVLYGASMVMQKFDTWLMLARGITIKSAAFDVGCYPMRNTAQVMRTALNLVTSGIITPEWIMTRKLDFEDTDLVADTFAAHRRNPDLKTVIRFGTRSATSSEVMAEHEAESIV